MKLADFLGPTPAELQALTNESGKVSGTVVASTYRGPFRGAILGAAERLHLLPKGTAEAARSGATWQEVGAAVNQATQATEGVAANTGAEMATLGRRAGAALEGPWNSMLGRQLLHEAGGSSPYGLANLGNPAGIAAGGAVDDVAHVTGAVADDLAHVTGSVADDVAHVTGAVADDVAHVAGAMTDDVAAVAGNFARPGATAEQLQSFMAQALDEIGKLQPKAQGALFTDAYGFLAQAGKVEPIEAIAARAVLESPLDDAAVSIRLAIEKAVSGGGAAGVAAAAEGAAPALAKIAGKAAPMLAAEAGTLAKVAGEMAPAAAAVMGEAGPALAQAGARMLSMNDAIKFALKVLR